MPNNNSQGRKPNGPMMNMNGFNPLKMMGSMNPGMMNNNMMDMLNMFSSMQNNTVQKNVGQKNRKSGAHTEQSENHTAGKACFGSFPADIIDCGSYFELRAELPGFRKEEVIVEVSNETVVVQTKNRHGSMEGRRDFILRERSCEPLQRTFALSNINRDEVEANFQDGILFLKLPKCTQERKNRRSIQIN